jgi:nucleoside-diphosphate-sugar epimerase
MKQRVLVVGGAGYIGPVVCDHLLSAGLEVTCLDRLLYGNGSCIVPLLGREGFEFIHGDMADEGLLDTLCRGMSSAVILAGLVGDPITKKFPDESHAVNDVGIRRLFDCLHRAKVPRVVFVSTCSNYGLSDGDQLLSESAPLKPLSAYARSKVAAEEYLLNEATNLGFSPTVLRFATAFGVAPRMRFDLTVNEFALELGSGKCLRVYDPDTWRPYCHVSDFARAILAVLRAPDEVVAREVFNVGGEANNHTKRQIVDILRRQLPDSAVTYEKAGNDARNYRVDFSKIRSILGFVPLVSVEQGVRDILRAVQSHLFDDIEARKNFYGNHHVSYELPRE